MRLVPAAAAAATASVALLAPAVAGAETHTVAPGDTLYSLARRFGTTVDELSRLNQLADPGQIRVGQVLTLAPVAPLPAPAPAPASPAPASPAPAATVGGTYQVAPGDTLWRIAVRHGVAVADVIALNGIANPDVLMAGQVLAIPGGGAPAPAPAAPAAPPVAAPLAGPAAPAAAPAATPAAAGTGALTHTVEPGDTLWSIAQRFGTSVDDLVARNGLDAGAYLGIGQTLEIRPAANLPRQLFGSRASDPGLMALSPVFEHWADAYGVPRDLLKATAYLESGWNNAALSSSGAKGIGQLMPETSAWINEALLGGSHLDPNVPEQNIQLSARYLRYLLDHGPGADTALAGYYQGLGAVRRSGVYPETVRYVQMVQDLRPYFS